MIKHHSYKIQNVIQKELFAAKHSIKICVAWFTNDLLFQPLLLKLDAGVEVAIITNKDEINFGENNDVDFDEFIQRGGCIYWNERGDKSRLLHHKFCIIDDSVVISGSYNWTNGAEYNDEDITVYSDEPETTKHYSDIFDKLAAQLPKSKGEVKRATYQEEQTVDLTQQLQAIYCEIGEYIDGLAKVCRTIGNSRLWGFVNEQGEEVIPCRYNSVEEFHGGLSFVCLGHYFGAIDKNGTEIIPFQHKSICWRDNNFIGAYLGNDELCVYDNSGVRIDSNRIIMYTSVDNGVIIPDAADAIDARIISNTYSNEVGVIVFDQGVTSIGKKAFSFCKKLKTITIPTGVKAIETEAFWCCEYMKHVTIPQSVTKIGERAFCGCNWLENLDIPQGVISIGNLAFHGCNLSTSIIIPNSVTRIGEGAFGYCWSLEQVSIGSGVMDIGNNPFSGCDKLVSFRGKYATDDGRALIKDGILISYAEGNRMLSYIIPDSVTIIGKSAFQHCGLSNITIPESVIMIQEEAFYNCRNLHVISIPDNVKTIEAEAFSNCVGLTNISIGKNVMNIGVKAFFRCKALANITIPDNVICIESKAFGECERLVSVTIGKGVTTIGDAPFAHCESLKEFKGKFAIDNGRCLIVNGVLKAFAPSCGTTEYTIPDSTTEVGCGAFANCCNLTHITIPDSVTIIGYYAFEGCDNLIYIYIGANVTEIRHSAIYLTGKPYGIYIKSTQPPAADLNYEATLWWEDEGYSCPTRIYVPQQSVKVYKVADGWKEYSEHIVGYDFDNMPI